MKGIYWLANQDIDLYLEIGDLSKLDHGETLSTELVDNNVKPIGKNLTLSLKESDKILDGFCLEKIRKNEKDYGYDSILSFQVMINQYARKHIVSQGHYGTRYEMESKIVVFNNRTPPF